MKQLVVLLSLTFSVVACDVEPQPINYGKDACHFCKMTIVDNQHAAELVTVKGRAFKYDAIECMMNHLKSWDHPPIEYHLVTDYESPGELIDATDAHYLVSESIPSPMGEFLTSFKNRSTRDQTKADLGGESLNWDQLALRFKLKDNLEAHVH